MLTGLAIGLLGLVLVPLAWLVPALRTRSNCLFHAFAQMDHHGGYLIFTPSKHGWWTHVYYSRALATFEEYAPPAKSWHRWPPVIFAGHVQGWIP